MGWETSFSIYFLCFAISLSRPVITDTVCHSIKQYFFVTDIYSTTKPSLKYWSLFFNLEYFWGRKKITDVWNLFPCNPLPSFFLCFSSTPNAFRMVSFQVSQIHLVSKLECSGGWGLFSFSLKKASWMLFVKLFILHMISDIYQPALTKVRDLSPWSHNTFYLSPHFSVRIQLRCILHKVVSISKAKSHHNLLNQFL